MSLDYTPVTVPNPPAQVNTVEQRPSTPPTITTQPSSAVVGGTTEVKLSNQENNNSAQNVTHVNNRNTVIQNIRGAQTQVGDISFESTSFYVNASTSINGDLEVQAGIIVPLGGGKIKRSASVIAMAKADAAKGGVCKSIRDAGFDLETVDALYPKSPEYRKCVKAAEVRTIVQYNDTELNILRLEIAELKAKLAEGRKNHQQVQVEHNKEVRGLW
jgi:hypothetical protein